MMPVGKLVRVVIGNSLRTPKQFILSSFGVVIGIGAFVFFLGLSLGVRNVVLGEMFPLDVVEVIPPQASMIGGSLANPITDETVAKIAARPEVEEAVPRMAINFAAIGRGWFDGNEIRVDLVGDGIATDYMADSAQAGEFRDWEVELDPAKLAPCGPAPKFRCDGPNVADVRGGDGLYYCDQRDMKCHHRVPVIVSPNLIEIYNKQFAESRGLPKIGGFEAFLVQRGGLAKMRMYFHLGESTVEAGSSRLLARPRMVEATMLGVSKKAIPIGVTVPIGYVKRWNKEFLGQEAAEKYSSVIIRLKNKNDVAPFGSWVVKGLDLRLEDQQGERFAMIIFIITGLFVLISFIIVTISAINIAHNFFMQVSDRRREIGVLRAIGATRGDIRGIILGEAALLGLASGVIGIALAVLAALGVDLLAANYLPDFPFKPDTFFDFHWIVFVSGVVFSVAFCVMGGFLPAERAAKMAPARALAQ
jgi:ABC-type lipoprotein release transport system permease subunit